MVPMNPFVGKEWRLRCRECIWDTVRREGVGRMEKVALTCIHYQM